jgi:hypothetical protein
MEMALTPATTDKQRDAAWTYIGQSTWVLQITPTRYLIRSTYRGADGGVGIKLMCIESEHNIVEFVGFRDDPYVRDDRTRR